MAEARETQTLYPCRNCGELTSSAFMHDCRQKQIDELKAKLAAQDRTLELIKRHLVMRGADPRELEG